MRSRCRCSMCPAIHITSRSWLRSSSTHEPSDPPLRVVIEFAIFRSPTSVYNYIHALSVHRPYIDIEREKKRHAGATSERQLVLRTVARVRHGGSPYSAHPVVVVVVPGPQARPTENDDDGTGTPTHTQPGNFVVSEERSNSRTNERVAPRRLSRNPIGFSGRPGPPLSVHYCTNVVSVVSPASLWDSVDRQTR